MTRSVTAAQRSRMADLAEQFEDIFMASMGGPSLAPHYTTRGTAKRTAMRAPVVTRTLLAKVLRAFRTRSGIAQEKLAASAGVDRTYVGSIERGYRNPTILVVDKLLAEMGVTWAEFGAALDRGDADSATPPA